MTPVGGDIDAWIDAGLYDPSAPDAGERRALLEYLVDRGAAIAELQQANDEQRLPALAGDLRRRGVLRVTARELADECGVDASIVLAISRATGLPAYDEDAAVYRVADAGAFAIAGEAIEVFGIGPVLEFSRTVGAALASIADAAIAMFGIEVAGRFDERGVSEVDRAAAIDAAAATLTEQVPVVLDTLLFHHVEAASGRGAGTSTVHMAVGFVDLVSSTELVHQLGPAELTDVIGAFERIAVETVSRHGGRVVKTIGDEVMFVVPEPRAACAAVREMRSAVGDDERLPAIRGGLTVGDLVRGYGDFYGADVTLAARIVRIAQPGVVLITDALRREAGDGVSSAEHGAHRLRGFPEPVMLYSLESA